MTLCKCGDPKAAHVLSTYECAACGCYRYAARDVVSVTTPARPRWMERLTARDESGFRREGVTL